MKVTFNQGTIDEASLRALLHASVAMNASLDTATTLHTIARSAAEVLRAEAASVLLHDPRRDKLVFRAAIGASGEQLLGEEMDAKRGIAGRVFSEGVPVRVGDARKDPDFFSDFDEQGDFRTRGLIAAPLRYREQVIGVVEVLNRKAGDFSDADIEILQVFGNLAAISVANAQLHDRLKRENLGLREVARQPHNVVGDSTALREVMTLCGRVAPTNATVLLLGETGTGKEVTARHIHNASTRGTKPFIAINCAALPETLLESELFGHEAGAFTGATERKLGRFELADQGTIFLDEIGDVSASTQVKLLRVLQEREFVRVGGSKTITCDVRIIAATNRDLQQAMQDGAFREDLYYRLNVFPIRLPPVRERREDIPKLVAHFSEKTALELGLHPPKVAPEALELLCAYHWPGNIRELRNVIERAVLLCDGRQILPEQLPREILGELKLPTETGRSALEGYEKAMIVKALEEHDWNQTQTAVALGISRDNLRYRLKKYQIRKPG